jgi:20S proteasome subunit alpha 2
MPPTAASQEPIPVLELVRGVAQTMQEFTQSGGVRPFGLSLLVAGWDTVDGPSLYQVDPAGTYFGWRASAIGKNQTSAKAFLERRHRGERMTVDVYERW